ncbi:MAG: antibiotic biosynthesis monooxygenase [Microscillaceae bacterium]|nr:antibiotic biosynthesis monooxygenase [Microscillaceae bacterium]
MGLTRIVRLHFREEAVVLFLQQFEIDKVKIRNFPGCLYLALWQDAESRAVYYTHSEWSSEDDLEHYRNSALFKEIWGRTKILFADKPQAFSAYKQEEV